MCLATLWVDGDDGVGVLGPSRGCAAVVPGADEPLDRGNEVGDGREVAAAQRLMVMIQKNASTRLIEEPEIGTRCRCTRGWRAGQAAPRDACGRSCRPPCPAAHGWRCARPDEERRQPLVSVPLMAGFGRVSGEGSMSGQVSNALNLTDHEGPLPPVDVILARGRSLPTPIQGFGSGAQMVRRQL